MRVSPAARRRLDRLVQGRDGAPQALWVRVEGSHVVPGNVSLALVDRPDPLPDGYGLQHGWTVPILVSLAHAKALRGARIEYDPASGAFDVRLAGELVIAEPASPPAESGCVSCSSASLPAIEALRTASGVASRGPALPIIGQTPLVEAHR